MLAIYKREFRAYFHSMTGWLFLAANLFLSGLYFFALNLRYGYAGIANTMYNIVFLLLITVPILTMRMLSEERRQKTDQLILTAPVSVGKIVAGKYLSAVTVFTISTGMICVYPLILSAFGTVRAERRRRLRQTRFFGAFRGFPVGDGTLRFGALFLGYMMSSITALISSTGNFLTRILNVLDMTTRLTDMMQGTLEVKSVLYFLSFILVFFFLTVQSIQKRRYQVSAGHLKMGAYSTGMIAVVLAAAVFLNLAVEELPSRYTSFDVTSERLYSLTDTTKELLAGLEEDVNIYILESEENQDTVLKQTLDRYAGLSSHIHVEYQDPVANPGFYQQYTDGNISMNSMIVESDRRYTVIDYADIYEYEYDYSSYTSTLTGYDGEGLITSAIAYVTSDDIPTMYVLEGQDELTLSTTFQDGLSKQNVTSESLNLLTVDSVPEEAEGVLILAPTADISTDDAQKLIDYLDAGGRILMTTSYTDNFAESFPNLQTVLDYFGISITEGLVAENDPSMYYQQPSYLLPDVAYDTVTDGVAGGQYVFMPYAQGITWEESDDIAVTSLLTTSESSVSKTNLDDAQTWEWEEGDIEGPFTVAVHASKTLDDENTAELYLYTSENLFTDSANSMVADANLTLFNNTIAAMTDGGTSVSVPVKSYQASDIMVNDGTAFLLGSVLMVILPLALLLFGLIRWLERRKG